MARIKFQTLTEQMFYVLLALREECCGTEIFARIRQMTDGRVTIGSGTLYNLLEQFLEAGMIAERQAEGRRRNYILTDHGRACLHREYERILRQAEDYRKLSGEE